jgi:N-acetylneuraminic acid mutarotase
MQLEAGYPTSKKAVEAYDPIANSWIAKANMLSNRLGMKAAVVDGMIYIIGGNYNERDCQVYNPITNTWAPRTSRPETGGALSLTVYDGIIYTFGGSTYSPWGAVSNVYAYNPKTDTWTKKQDMPTPRFAFQTYLVNNKIYAMGGSQSDYGTGQSLATLEVYDPVTNTWETRPNMPFNIAWFAGAVVNDLIYVIGGTQTFGTTSSYSVWEYDPAFVVSVESSPSAKITNYQLEQNYPNPFNPSTKISWQLPASSQVTLRVYDILGKEVATLIDEYKQAGKYEIEFNAANLPSDVYFYKLQAGSFLQTRKMILLK